MAAVAPRVPDPSAAGRVAASDLILLDDEPPSGAPHDPLAGSAPSDPDDPTTLGESEIAMGRRARVEAPPAAIETTPCGSSWAYWS